MGGLEESHLSAPDGMVFMASKVMWLFIIRFIVHDFQLLPVSLTQGDLCCISKNRIGSPLFSHGDRRLSIMVLPIVFTIECREVDKI